MATIINGSREDIHPSGQGSDAQPSALQAVTWAVWDTVWNKTFAVGAVVGATLMYVGSRVAQAYLSEAGGQDPDRPF